LINIKKITGEILIMIGKIGRKASFILLSSFLVAGNSTGVLAANSVNVIKDGPQMTDSAIAGASTVLASYYEAVECGKISTSSLEIVVTPGGLLTPSSVLEQYTNIGVANVDNYLNIRKEPGTDSEIVGKLTKNGGCEILESLGDWYRVQSGPVTGYVSAEFIMTGETAKKAAVANASLVAKINTDALRVRTEPNTDARIWTLVYNTERYEVLERLDGWAKIEMDTSEGYISLEYVDVLYALPEATKYSIATDVSAFRQSIVQYAMQFLGNPYVWGGTNPNKGADCSGFVQYILRNAAGVSVSRTAREQAKNGNEISASQMRAGDLVFYSSGGAINHVAMYIGNGQVIHAANKRSGIKISAYNYRTPVKIVNVVGN